MAMPDTHMLIMLRNCVAGMPSISPPTAALISQVLFPTLSTALPPVCALGFESPFSF